MPWRAALAALLLLIGSASAQPADPRLARAEAAFATARSLWGSGDLARIDALLREALDLQMAVLGTNDLLVARTLDYMGRNSFNGRQFPRAEQLFRLSARIAIPKTGEMTIDVAYYFGSIGASLREQGKFAEARPWVCHSLAIRRALLPADDPLIASSFDNLGRIAYGEGRFGEARALVEESHRLYLLRYASTEPLLVAQARLIDDLRRRAPNAPPFDTLEPCGPVPIA